LLRVLEGEKEESKRMWKEEARGVFE